MVEFLISLARYVATTSVIDRLCRWLHQYQMAVDAESLRCRRLRYCVCILRHNISIVVH